MSATQILHRARRLLAANDPEGALDCIDGVPESRTDVALRVLRIQALRDLDRRFEAIEQTRALCAEFGDDPVLLRPAGKALIDMGEPVEGMRNLQRAYELDPGDAAQLFVLVDGFLAGHSPEMEPWLRQAIDSAAAQSPIGVVAGLRLADGMGDLAAAQAWAQQGIRAFPDDPLVLAQYAFLQNYRSGITVQDHVGAHKRFGRAVESRIRPFMAGFRNAPDPDRRLRLGFVSQDFRRHVVSDFILELVSQLDRSQFEVLLYSVGTADDEVSERFRAVADHWVSTDVVELPGFGSRVREDQIDVLVDLGGLTWGQATAMFALRLAPVQVTYLGSPATTGLSRMDFRLVDTLTDPEGSDDQSTERLLRLPSPFICYRPLRPFPPPQWPEGPVTFGCLGRTTKVTDEALRLWADLLGRVPESRLLLAYRSMRSPAARALLQRRATDAGIAADRLEIVPGMLGDDFQGLYGRIHVALDTFPYNGTTTVCEATYMGVPTVTLQGSEHRSRVAASLLTAVGHAEWIASASEGYVDTAVRLATNLPELRRLRTTLRDDLLRSPLGDLDQFRPRFEGAIRQAWRQWCEVPR